VVLRGTALRLRLYRRHGCATITRKPVLGETYGFGASTSFFKRQRALRALAYSLDVCQCALGDKSRAAGRRLDSAITPGSPTSAMFTIWSEWNPLVAAQTISVPG